jgi:hypothetical protein
MEEANENRQLERSKKQNQRESGRRRWKGQGPQREKKERKERKRIRKREGNLPRPLLFILVHLHGDTIKKRRRENTKGSRNKGTKGRKG